MVDGDEPGTSAATEFRRRARRRAIFAASLKRGASHATAYRRVAAAVTDDGRWRNVCAWCGDPFTSKRSDAKYCKPLCRQNAGRTARGR